MKKSSYKNSILSDSQIKCPSLELLEVMFLKMPRENINFTTDIRDWSQSRASKNLEISRKKHDSLYYLCSEQQRHCSACASAHLICYFVVP